MTITPKSACNSKMRLRHSLVVDGLGDKLIDDQIGMTFELSHINSKGTWKIGLWFASSTFLGAKSATQPKVLIEVEG